jgi:hypothetical protein
MPGPLYRPGTRPAPLLRRSFGALSVQPVGGRAPAVLTIPFSWISSPIARKPTIAITKAQIGQDGGATAYSSATAAQVLQYGVNTAQVTLDTACDADPQNLAAQLTTYEAVPRPRQPTLTFDLFDLRWATDANALTILGVDLAQRIRITGAPVGTPLGATEFTVEGIKHVIGVEQRTVTWSTAALIGTTTPGGLRVPGLPGSNATTPDAAPLDVIGDLDLRADLTPYVWADGSFKTVVAKWNQDAVNQRSYLLQITDVGALQLGWSNDGTAVLAASSTVSVPATSGRLTIRATLDVDNGAAGRTITFYTAASIAGPWTQLGAAVVQAGVTSIFNGNASGQVSGHSLALPAAADVAPYTVHSIEIRDGINGTVVANPVFWRDAPPGARSFTDTAGRAWTVNGIAQLVDGTVAPGPWFRWDTSTWGGTDLRPF